MQICAPETAVARTGGPTYTCLVEGSWRARLWSVEFAQGGDGARNGRREVRRVCRTRGGFRHDGDEAREQVIGTGIAQALAQDAEQQSSAEDAVHGAPGAQVYGRHVDQAEESVNGVLEMLNAQAPQDSALVELRNGGRDGRAAELGDQEGGVQVEHPVLRLVFDRGGFANVPEVVGGFGLHLFDGFAEGVAAAEARVNGLVGNAIAYNVKADLAEPVHAFRVRVARLGRVRIRGEGTVDDGGGRSPIVGERQHAILPQN